MGSSDILMLVLLSQVIIVGSRGFPNNFDKSFLNQTVYFPTSHATIYSTSTLFTATRSCFLLIHAIIVDPKLKYLPVVLLPSVAPPPQLESVKPIKLASFPSYFS